tara:strand:+ start:936 stop:1388 length:453 start_codon:yes stop_codon:yes gene_type:complete
LEYIQDIKKLSKKTKKCKRLIEGKMIGDRLIEVLRGDPNACGLSANQIGINFAVCVVYVKQPLVLINPEIIGKFGKSYFQEGCLSFPGSYIMTERWTDILVSADNHKKTLSFSFDKDALECVCVQHEIDHLNGITMFDRMINMEDLNVKV